MNGSVLRAPRALPRIDCGRSLWRPFRSSRQTSGREGFLDRFFPEFVYYVTDDDAIRHSDFVIVPILGATADGGEATKMLKHPPKEKVWEIGQALIEAFLSGSPKLLN